MVSLVSNMLKVRVEGPIAISGRFRLLMAIGSEMDLHDPHGRGTGKQIRGWID